MVLPGLNIGGLNTTLPIVQGGMGIGVSGYRLAAGVANRGGVGVISGVNIGYREPDFRQNPLEANLRAIKSEIRKARELAPNGIIGMNFLVALNHYNEMVRSAVEEGIDLIISGAGLPVNLPELVKGSRTKIAPIVSSEKAAGVILKYWDTHYGQTADMVVVEGPEAGGHLGFSEEILSRDPKPSVIEITKRVLQAIRPFQEKYEKNIPVVAAGGIFRGKDIADCLKAGAAGVQMATRFVATDECDADLKFKEAYLKAQKEDIVIIHSPVGMPGRALLNPFIQKVTQRGDEIKICFRCLKNCNPKVAPYCISNALIHAVTGNVEDGLIFVGSNVDQIHEIVPLDRLMDELVEEATLWWNR